MAAIRARVFIAVKACPHEAAFDGKDLCATHFLVFDLPDAVATLRMRWFAGFARRERAEGDRDQPGMLDAPVARPAQSDVSAWA